MRRSIIPESKDRLADDEQPPARLVIIDPDHRQSPADEVERGLLRASRRRVFGGPGVVLDCVRHVAGALEVHAGQPEVLGAPPLSHRGIPRRGQGVQLAPGAP